MTKIPTKNNGNNDWVAYRALVLDKLEKLDSIEETQIQIRLDVRELKVRAAVWGGAAGFGLSMVVVGVSFLLQYLAQAG